MGRGGFTRVNRAELGHRGGKIWLSSGANGRCARSESLKSLSCGNMEGCIRRMVLLGCICEPR